MVVLTGVHVHDFHHGGGAHQHDLRDQDFVLLLPYFHEHDLRDLVPHARHDGHFWPVHGGDEIHDGGRLPLQW